MKGLLKLLAAVAFGYVLVCGTLYWRQRDLLYLPQFTRIDAARTDFALPRPDAVLRGWVLNPGQRRALLYFGGNGEAVEHNRDDFRRWFPDRTVYLLAYRGYGASDGHPTQAALFDDALALFDAVHGQHLQVDAIGRSLGSGVATYLATQRPIRRLALITPYDSIARVAQSAYPFAPVSLLLQDRFDSWSYAAQVRNPVLILAAQHDEVIPAASTDALVASFPAPPERYLIAAARHNTIHRAPAYAEVLRRFLVLGDDTP